MVMILCSILGTGFSIEKMQTEQEEMVVNSSEVSNQMVIPGGIPIGIYLQTDGVLVLGTDSVLGADGQERNPAEHIVKAGDYIVGINGSKIDSKKSLIHEVSELSSDYVILQIRRETECFEVKINPVKTEDNSYKLGIWVRDSVQGLGTITYITEKNKFGALGHGIHDADTDSLIAIEQGRVYETQILRIQKGRRGVPGGMEGMIVYNRFNRLGTIEKNTELGVYGTIDDVDSMIENVEPVEVCEKENVKTGEAQIRCCVSGNVEEYDIEIQKIDRYSKEVNKGMVIKVVDEELLEKTGGIVQGMSGSPILQDGKIVGAVTHVFVNDPTKGYGIFIENMLNAAG